jgi:hypothetical protein
MENGNTMPNCCKTINQEKNCSQRKTLDTANIGIVFAVKRKVIRSQSGESGRAGRALGFILETVEHTQERNQI